MTNSGENKKDGALETSGEGITAVWPKPLITEKDYYDLKSYATKLEEKLAVAITALERLCLVGPPSRSCNGDEVNQVIVTDNCAIARAALEKLKGDG